MVNMTPTVFAKLEKFAGEHVWSVSTAAAVLIEVGLLKQEDED